MAETKKVTAEGLVKFCAKIADDRKAEDIKIIKVGEVSLVADYFLICTANATPHINAIAEWIRRKVREEYNIRPISIDGEPVSQWTIIDFGDVVVHIFSSEARGKYQLENLWGDATKLEKILAEKVNRSKK